MSLTDSVRAGERFHVHTIPLYLVDRFAKAFGLSVFVETGTYTGSTVEHVEKGFSEVFTIELDEKLAAAATSRFSGRKHVHVAQGESGVRLAEVLLSLGDRRALFWLDAHWSGGITARQDLEIHTSVRAELSALKSSVRRDHVIMIDDIDDFQGVHGYPTQNELVELVREINPDYQIEILKVRRGVLVAYPVTGR